MISRVAVRLWVLGLTVSPRAQRVYLHQRGRLFGLCMLGCAARGAGPAYPRRRLNASLLHCSNAAQQPAQQVGTRYDPPLRTPDKDHIVVDYVVAWPFRGYLQAPENLAEPRLHVPDDNRPVPIRGRIAFEPIEQRITQKMIESKTKTGSPPRSVTITHFLPEAPTCRINGSVEEISNFGSTHLLFTSGRLIILWAWTGSPSSATATSSRSRKFCAPVASNTPMSPPLAALRAINERMSCS